MFTPTATGPNWRVLNAGDYAKLVPDADNTTDFGSSSKRYKTGNFVTVHANTLSDYSGYNANVSNIVTFEGKTAVANNIPILQDGTGRHLIDSGLSTASFVPLLPTPDLTVDMGNLTNQRFRALYCQTVNTVFLGNPYQASPVSLVVNRLHFCDDTLDSITAGDIPVYEDTHGTALISSHTNVHGLAYARYGVSDLPQAPTNNPATLTAQDILGPATSFGSLTIPAANYRVGSHYLLRTTFQILEVNTSVVTLHLFVNGFEIVTYVCPAFAGNSTVYAQIDAEFQFGADPIIGGELDVGGSLKASGVLKNATNELQYGVTPAFTSSTNVPVALYASYTVAGVEFRPLMACLQMLAY